VTRILILHASLGSGHISAAQALQEAFTHFPEVEVQVEDALAHASPVLRETLTRLYKQLSERAPHLYRMLYEGMDTEDLEASLEENLRLAKLERPFFQRLENLITEHPFDAVVCVQQIPSRILQLLQQEENLIQPHYVVITDVIAHSTWINPGVNRYFVPSQLTADVLSQKGVDPSLLSVTGIPVALEITQPKSQAAMRSKHHLPLQAPVITLFGGGLHPKRVHLMVNKLLEHDSTGMLVVATGRNQELMESLAELSPGQSMQYRLLGMIDYVDDLVAASDLVISKAGGLIVSEVTARGTPLVIIDPFPGQEEWNADAVATAGAGIQLRLPEMVPPAVLWLLDHPEQLTFMRHQARQFGKPQASLEIARQILRDLEQASLTQASLSLSK
jgi:processive 1,2-diacylglycerol beta-glucosyltransferase